MLQLLKTQAKFHPLIKVRMLKLKLATTHAKVHKVDWPLVFPIYLNCLTEITYWFFTWYCIWLALSSRATYNSELSIQSTLRRVGCWDPSIVEQCLKNWLSNINTLYNLISMVKPALTWYESGNTWFLLWKPRCPFAWLKRVFQMQHLAEV